MIIEFSKTWSLIIYVCLFIIISFGVTKFRNNKFLCFLFLSFAIFLFGFRYNGTDTITYEQIISRYGLMNIQSIFALDNLLNEIGFKLLCSIFYDIGGFSLINIIIGIIIVLPVYSVFLEKIDSYDLFIMSFIFLIAFFTVSFNIMRQFLAVSLITYAYNELIKQKRLKYLIVTLIAISFHNTGIISIIFYVYNYIKDTSNNLSKKRLLKLIFIAFFGLIFIYFIISYFTTNLYSEYLDNTLSGKNRDFYIIVLKFCVLLLLRKKLLLKNREINEYVYFLFFGVLIGIIGFYNMYIKRLYYFFNIYECIAFSLVPSIFKQKEIIRIFIIVLYILMFILTAAILSQGDIIPLKLRF